MNDTYRGTYYGVPFTAEINRGHYSIGECDPEVTFIHTDDEGHYDEVDIPPGMNAKMVEVLTDSLAIHSVRSFNRWWREEGKEYYCD